jgi:hypothetical protein
MATKHVGVQQDAQGAAEGGSSQEHQSYDESKRKLKLKWWEERSTSGSWLSFGWL